MRRLPMVAIEVIFPKPLLEGVRTSLDAHGMVHKLLRHTWLRPRTAHVGQFILGEGPLFCFGLGDHLRTLWLLFWRERSFVVRSAYFFFSAWVRQCHQS